MSQLYTLDDVALNTGDNGMPCWIIVRDIVYDCTDYLDDVSTLPFQLCIENHINRTGEKEDALYKTKFHLLSASRGR